MQPVGRRSRCGDRYQMLKVWEMAKRKSLSKELRSARERRGLSVAEVADRVGVSQASIYFWEGGRVRPRSENLKLLCKVLKLSARDAMEATGV